MRPSKTWEPSSVDLPLFVFVCSVVEGDERYLSPACFYQCTRFKLAKPKVQVWTEWQPSGDVLFKSLEDIIEALPFTLHLVRVQCLDIIDPIDAGLSQQTSYSLAVALAKKRFQGNTNIILVSIYQLGDISNIYIYIYM